MRPTLVIAGPTAVGKSALALEVAERLDGEIVSADALQVYRGFDIGTAKPDSRDRCRVAHHLVDMLDPEEAYSAGEFARRAREVIEQIRRRGRVPLVVGGSGLYLRALTTGLARLPEVSEKTRRELRERLKREGLSSLRAQLQARDPATARRLDPNDTQRILRALEILEATGRPLSRWLLEAPEEPTVSARTLALTLPRRLLYDAIAARVERMMSRGWLNEVRTLLQGGVPRQAPAFQAIGYQQLAAVVAGESDLEDATGEIVRSTRRYAKRQLTWFRNQTDVFWIEAEDSSARLEMTMKWIKADSG